MITNIYSIAICFYCTILRVLNLWIIQPHFYMCLKKKILLISQHGCITCTVTSQLINRVPKAKAPEFCMVLYCEEQGICQTKRHPVNLNVSGLSVRFAAFVFNHFKCIIIILCSRLSHRSSERQKILNNIFDPYFFSQSFTLMKCSRNTVC